MTFADGLWLALVRAGVVAVVTVASASVVAPWLADANRQTRRVAAALLIGIIFTPMLVLGYVYSSGDVTLVRYPIWNDLLYGLLLCAKCLPIAVGVLMFAPPAAVSDAGLHCARLAPPTSALRRHPLRTWWALAMQAHGRAWLLAGIAVFLLTFQEFELASLLHGNSGRQASAYTWTIALREARELQTPMSTIWLKAIFPMAIQLLAVIVGLRVLRQSERQAAETSATTKRPIGVARRVFACTILTIACALALFLPWWTVIRTGIGGMGQLFDIFQFGDELIASVMFAGAATCLLLVLLELFHARTPFIAFVLVCLPGLMGGLLLALALIALCQPLGTSLATLNLDDSPIPLLIGLVAWLLPITLLLRWLFTATEQRASNHTARLALRCSIDNTTRMRVRQLIWRLVYRWRYWLAMLVFSLAYFELILSVLLAPTSMTGAMALLYNLFHYGQNAVRSAMIMVMVAVPMLLVLASLLISPVFPLLVRAKPIHTRN